MKVAYFGRQVAHTSSWHRAEALGRRGHDVVSLDPHEVSPRSLKSRWLSAFHFRTGYQFLEPGIRRWLIERRADWERADLIWVDGGELFGPDCLRLLRSAGIPVVLYNLDDPTGSRDGRRFQQVRRSLAQYDLSVAVRKESEEEMRRGGARRVLRVWRGYDEVDHAPAPLEDVPDALRSEVAFIGTWMPGEHRDVFLMALVEAGVPLSIWGDAWSRSPLWSRLQSSWRGPCITGRDYVRAIRGAKICLGLLSKGNRDLHTQRSAEIPFAGGVFCAERTTEHLELYRENVEAAFWRDASECAQRCRQLLADDQGREAMRLAGMAKVRALKIGNEDVVTQVLTAALDR